MFIKGVGMTKFGSQKDSSQELVYQASMEAIEDSNIGMDQIDAIVISSIDTESNGERQRLFANVISSILRRKVPIINPTAVCGGGGAALWSAINLDYKNILVIGVDRLLTNNSVRITDEIMMAAERIYEQTEGLNFPAQNALVAQQYMRKYGATMDDLSLVAFKNHSNAYLNPKAKFYKKEVTLKQIKKSPVVASPLRLFDCSLSVNGAAAVVLSKEPTDIEIVASSLSTGRIATFESEDMTSWDASVSAAKEAFAQAGITPKDINLAELHDAFTSVELISYEDLGFCKKGEGKYLIRKGITNLNGSLPVNASGGLKAKGHPISATGVSQIYELAKQMRKQAGDRQVEKTDYALAQNIGGAGSTVSVHILKKVKA
ncbi:MAG TPA: thiolase domain-containing protein [Candidatus Nanoarchaeia archaeon]|nr:thiolase domain-containing protein [Candidatus Nanoarchaeia archaeon]